MGVGLVNGREDTGRLDDVLGTGLGPLDVGGVSLVVDGDGLAVDVELAVLDLGSALESAVGLASGQHECHASVFTCEVDLAYGVVLEHVDHVLEVNEGAEDVSVRSYYVKAGRGSLVDSGDFNVAVLNGVPSLSQQTCDFLSPEHLGFCAPHDNSTDSACT